MIDKLFSPGSKIELHPIRKGPKKDGEKDRIYISQINQVLGEDKIEILMPIEQGKLILLPVNSMYSVVAFTSKGMFQCDVRIIERYKSGNIHLQVVELVTPIKKYQRREYYRYSCSLPITTRRLEDAEKERLVWDHDLPGVQGIVIDIGGGGIRFLTEQMYEAGEDIICCVKLESRGELKEIQALGRVLSSKEVTKGNEKKEVRVRFEIISNSTREEIIQFIFEDERRRRRKNNSWH